MYVNYVVIMKFKKKIISYINYAGNQGALWHKSCMNFNVCSKKELEKSIKNFDQIIVSLTFIEVANPRKLRSD